MRDSLLPGHAMSQINETSAAAAADEAALVAAGNQFQLAVAEFLPTIPLAVRNSIWVQRPNVHGWIPHQYDIYPHYNDVWLD